MSAYTVANQGPPAEIAKYLKDHLEPGDTVQPMDWTGAKILKGMLIARAKVATSFVYDFHFLSSCVHRIY